VISYSANVCQEIGQWLGVNSSTVNITSVDDTSTASVSALSVSSTLSFDINKLNKTGANRVENKIQSTGSSAALELYMQSSGVADLIGVAVKLNTSSVTVSSTVTVVFPPTSSPSPAPTASPSSSPTYSESTSTSSSSSSSSISQYSEWIIIGACGIGGIALIAGVVILRRSKKSVRARKPVFYNDAEISPISLATPKSAVSYPFLTADMREGL
jgi:hypothetical protein